MVRWLWADISRRRVPRVFWMATPALAYSVHNILLERAPLVAVYICIHVYIMSGIVSYGHPASGLKIVSVAIPMASSCSICLYNILNSRFRLLPILGCTCGGQFSDRLRQSVCHFLPLVPVKIPPVHRAAGQNGVSCPKRVPGVRKSKALGSEKTFDCAIAAYCPYTSDIAQDIYVAAWYASGS